MAAESGNWIESTDVKSTDGNDLQRRPRTASRSETLTLTDADDVEDARLGAECHPAKPVGGRRASLVRLDQTRNYFLRTRSRSRSIGSVDDPLSARRKTSKPFAKDCHGLRTSIYVDAGVAAKLEATRYEAFTNNRWMHFDELQIARSQSDDRSDSSVSEADHDGVEIQASEYDLGDGTCAGESDRPLSGQRRRFALPTARVEVRRSMWDAVMSGDGQSVGKATETIIFDDDIFGGFVVDFLYRSWIKMRSTRKDSRYFNFFDGLGVCLESIASTRSTGPATEKIQKALEEYPIYEDVIRFACDERLIWFLLEDVTQYRKDHHQSPWGACDGGTFRKRVQAMIKHNKQTAALKAEVHDFTARRASECNSQSRPTLKEDLEDRHERHQRFWKQFHAGARKCETSLAWTAQATKQSKKSRPLPDLKRTQSSWKTRPASNGNRVAKQPRPNVLQLSQSASGISARSESTLFGSSNTLWGSPHGDSRDELRPTSRSSASDMSMRRKRQALTGFQEILLEAERNEIDADCLAPRPAKPTADLLNSVSHYLCPKQLMSKKAASSPSLCRDTVQRNNTGQLMSGRTFFSVNKNYDTYSNRDADFFDNRDMEPNTLQEERRFTSPWHSGGGASIWHAQTNTGRYLRSCQGRGVLPKTQFLPFMTGHSTKLQARGVGLNDHDLSSASAMSMAAVKIEEIDIGDNISLSDKALVIFLTHLQMDTLAVAALRQLSLRNCVQAGMGTVDTLIRLVLHQSSILQHLDISGISLGAKLLGPFSQAIQGHPCLRVLKMAETGFSHMCVSDILRNRNLEALDLSWNCFTAEIFEAIGQRVVESQQLISLALSNCSSLFTGDDARTTVSPIVSFIEQLAWDKHLRTLDLSMNRLDFRGCLVIEDALEYHKKLSELDVTGNPLGLPGMRNILRLLARDTSGLMHITAQQCNISVTPQEPAEDHHVRANAGEAVFHTSNPAGRYDLKLVTPYHRAVLRMLCKICDRFRIQPDASFSHVSYSMPPYAHPSKDETGIWSAPCKGRLRFCFHLEPAMVAAFRGLGEDRFSILLERYFDLTRVKPGFKKFIALSAHWKSLRDQAQEQDVFLNAMAKDFLLTSSQASQLSTSHESSGASSPPFNASAFYAAVIGSITGGRMAKYLFMLGIPTLAHYVNTEKRAHSLLYLNVDNPTGHYSLDLHSPCDYAVAEKLIIIDQWEIAVAQRSSYFDTSQHGNLSHFRNATHMDNPMTDTPCEWIMPEHGVFEFDYASSARPELGANELDTCTFSNILLVLGQAQSSSFGPAHAIRQISHYIYVSSQQLREIMGVLDSTSVRAEVFVALFLRITDIWNEKMFRVCFGDASEITALQRRLGCATFFPFIQPEQFQIEYDCAFHDQRLAIHLICMLNAREGGRNFRNYSYTHQDGTVDPLPIGVPRSWETFNKCPKQGTFRGAYVCASDSRVFKLRKELLESYGHWVLQVDEDEVKWWAALSEAPYDVISYLEFLIPRFANLERVYDKISHGHGEINLREFEDSIKRMRCKKFTGPNESDRIKSIFRYLDPNGHGTVSKGEWGVLDLLWKEINMSVEELKCFLHRTFHGNLCLAWDFFDEDQSGEIDIDEWRAAVHRIGYFGSVEHTFHYIDLDDTGTVGWTEFEAMWERLDLHDSWAPISHNASIFTVASGEFRSTLTRASAETL